MSKKLYEETNIQAVASAIREKNGTQNQYTVAQMASAVRAIQTQPTLQEKTIVDNGSYTPDEGYDGFSEVTVMVSSGGDSSGGCLVDPSFQGLSYCYVTSNGTDFYSDSQRNQYLNIFEVQANHTYVLAVGSNVGVRRRASFFPGKTYAQFEPYLSVSGNGGRIFSDGVWLAPYTQNSDDTGSGLIGRIIYTPSANGVIVYGTDNAGNTCPAYCVDLNASGSGSAVIQPLSVTQNGTYNPPSGVDGFGPVTVNVSSQTPTPDEKCIDRWDFTSGTPLTGTLNDKVITQNNTTFDSNGAHFVDNSYIAIPNLTAGEERLIRIVLGQCTSINPSRNHRFVMTSQTNGFLWVEYGAWGFYNGTFETNANLDNLLAFSNSELIIHIDTDGTWEVYKDSELVYSPTQKIVAPSTMYIGSSDQSINGFTIEKLEIYRDIDPSDFVPSGTEIEVIPLSVGSNGVYAAPSGKAYSPVSVNVSGGNSGISAGTADPIASYGSDGDVYIKYLDVGNTAVEHAYAAKVTKFKRGTSDLNYVSAAEIDLIFDDGNGGEVSIRDISDFSYWTINGAGNRNVPSGTFDNDATSFSEYSPVPVTWFMAATIPPTYTPKTLRVMQRNYNGGSDVWSSFTLSDVVDDAGVSVEILSEENLQTTDWAGVSQWTDFACNGTKVGGKVPLKYFVKENGSWNEITKDAAMSGITEILA